MSDWADEILFFWFALDPHQHWKQDDALDAEMLHYARLHHDVIARFGRFPHRNATLGREPRPDEIAAGDVTPW